MSDNQQPTRPNQESTPNASSEQEGREMSTGGAIPSQHQDTDPQASGNPEATSTQQNMGDGSGIRGDYGNASQTNGAEGVDQASADGAPEKKKDQWAE